MTPLLPSNPNGPVFPPPPHHGDLLYTIHLEHGKDIIVEHEAMYDAHTNKDNGDDWFLKVKCTTDYELSMRPGFPLTWNIRAHQIGSKWHFCKTEAISRRIFELENKLNDLTDVVAKHNNRLDALERELSNG